MGVEDAFERSDSRVAWVSIKCRAKRSRVNQVRPIGGVDRRLHLVAISARRKVDQRLDHRNHRDPLPHRPSRQSTPVNHHPLDPRPPVGRHADMNRTALAGHPVERAGAPMREAGALPAGEHRRHPAAAAGEVGIERIHPPVDRKQPASREAMPNRLIARTPLQQLRVRDDSVLATGHGQHVADRWLD